MNEKVCPICLDPVLIEIKCCRCCLVFHEMCLENWFREALEHNFSVKCPGCQKDHSLCSSYSCQQKRIIEDIIKQRICPQNCADYCIKISCVTFSFLSVLVSFVTIAYSI